MKYLKNIPIRRKLIFVTMITSGAAVLLACLAFTAYEFFAARNEMIADLSGTAAMVGDNSSAALAFDDVDSAKLSLHSLSVYPNIVVGAVYDKTGQLFAVYQRKDALEATIPARAGADGYRFTLDGFSLYRRIELANDVIGTVYIRSDLGVLADRAKQYAWIMAVVMLMSAGPAYLLAAMLQTSISGPIHRLAYVVGLVSAGKDYSLRVTKEGEDELGRLIDGFNEMLTQIQLRGRALIDARKSLERRIEERQQAQAELELTHKQLVDASRQAGMAEIATNVLHNVGNVLNSVNVSAGLLAQRIKRSKASGIGRVAELIQDHTLDFGSFMASEQGKLLPIYLRELAADVAREQQAMALELAELAANVEHIKEIVAVQQSYAKRSGVVEILDVRVLVEDSLRINAEALVRHGVTLVREFSEIPPIQVDKHKLLQILVNLIRNAKYACEESSNSDKRIVVRIAEAEGELAISVIDTGVGISADNLTRIFNHGFTTRAAGHGFGLHSSALAAAEFGGSLQVESAGLGKGATFTLKVPLVVSEMLNVA